MRVILDTNVLVSGLISEIGPPARIVDAVLRGEIIPVMSPATFAELEDVFHAPNSNVTSVALALQSSSFLPH